ncbi:MAG: leucyl aminopeptidase [Acidimicrobiia bacterium]
METEIEMEIVVVGSDSSLEGATLIAAVLEGVEAAPGSAEALASVDVDALEAMGFKGESGQTILLPHDEAEALLLVGLGEEVSFEGLRAASGNAVRTINSTKAVSLLGLVPVDGATRAVAEGSLLGGYQFRRYKTGEAESRPDLVEIVDGDSDELATALSTARATVLARDWINTPAIDQSPEALAEMITESLADLPVSIEVWDRARIEAERLGAVLGVAAGSTRDPRVVILRYRPDGPVAHLTLVGKGITFDSGGLSIKPAASMEEMKDDMSGAATVAAVMTAVSEQGLPIDLTCITPLTDNAVGGNATRPGDVLIPRSGPTIEVLNTDAEGRLVLADGLSLAVEEAPDLVVDVATLTGAARVALGDGIGAVFASDSKVAGQVLDAASAAGEKFWEMPLHKEYRKSMDSNIADIKNISGSRYGGAITAAIFLAEYAGDGDWAHLDIAGPARARETKGDLVKGASGIGVRTLVELARTMSQTD